METLWYKSKIFTSNEIDIIRMNSFTINMKKKNEIWYIKNRKLENNEFLKNIITVYSLQMEKIKF